MRTLENSSSNYLGEALKANIESLNIKFHLWTEINEGAFVGIGENINLPIMDVYVFTVGKPIDEDRRFAALGRTDGWDANLLEFQGLPDISSYWAAGYCVDLIPDGEFEERVGHLLDMANYFIKDLTQVSYLEWNESQKI